MQHLTLVEVKARARDAYCAKKLTAQHPVREMRKCIYRTPDGYGCAIGVALNEKALAALKATGRLGSPAVALAFGYIADIEYGAMEIQNLHDAWASASRNVTGTNTPDLIAMREQQFREAIYS